MMVRKQHFGQTPPIKNKKSSTKNKKFSSTKVEIFFYRKNKKFSSTEN